MEAETTMFPSIALPESQKCRARAIEFREMAELFHLENARDQVLNAAANYERMAWEAERREIAQGISHLRAAATKSMRI